MLTAVFFVFAGFQVVCDCGSLYSRNMNFIVIFHTKSSKKQLRVILVACNLTVA